MDYFQSRFARPNCSYYKIIEEEHTVGLVRTTVAEDAEQGWLGLIGIDPDHRRKGYGHKAIKTEPEQEGMDMVYMEKWIGDSDA